MRAAGPGAFAKENGILGYLHYLVFPLDLFMSGDEHFDAARDQRLNELTPIMFWLIPLLLLLSNLTYLNLLGLVALFLVECILLVILSAIYCWRASFGFLIETFVNYALSFFLLGFLIFAVMFMFASCGIVIVVIAVIAAIAYFSRGSGQYYDDDW
jgi:uncharacterized membrane protein